MYTLKLKCDCGKVEGTAKNINPKDGTRVVCYCNSCQNFARFLRDQGQTILDEQGGTDIYQLAPSKVTFTKGCEHIKGMRLSDKGVHRWYTECCRTPIGNTAGLKLPFIGLIHNIIDDLAHQSQNLGPVRARVYTDGARTQLPPPEHKLLSQKAYVVKLIFKFLWWKLTGQGRPSPFYHDDGKRIYPMETRPPEN